jgi:hypothetical protein
MSGPAPDSPTPTNPPTATVTSPATTTPATAAVPVEGTVARRPATLTSTPPLDLARLLGARWPAPAAPPAWLDVAVVAVGAVAAVVLPLEPRIGLGALLLALAAAVPVVVAALGHRGRGPAILGGLAVGLAAVSAIRASEWLAFLCLLGATGLGIAAVFDARSWAGVLRCGPASAVAILRSVPWLGRARARRFSARAAGADRTPWQRQMQQERSLAWATGLAVGVFAALVVGVLLATGDAAFAHVLGRLVPDIGPIDLGTVPARVVWFGIAAAAVLGGVYGVRSRVAWPRPLGPQRVRHAVEWLTPLVLVGTVIALFFAVQATMLFGGADVVLRGSGISHASRARQGFGQLFLVTLIVLGLLAWAGRLAARGGPRERRIFGVAGGVLTGMALLLAGSALRRLWLYQEQYGWTVARIVAGAAEIWISFILVAVAVAWLLRRVDLLPRLVIGSAGAGLLVLALAAPDALAARWNVERFADTGRLDAGYVSRLSDDAVPALQQLPDHERACVLAGRVPVDDGWTTWNLGRARAAASLREDPPPPRPADCASEYGSSNTPQNPSAAGSHP